MTPGDPARPWRTLCLAASALALAVTAAVLVGGVLPGEQAALRLVHDAVSPTLADLGRLANHGGTWRVLVPATGILFAGCPHARRRWWLWCATFVLAPLVGEAWQEAVGRPRPVGAALGFPSGHATATATFAIAVLYLVKQTALGPTIRRVAQALPIAGALAVGAARIVLGAHWPTDVVGGFALGTACAAGTAWWDAAHPAPSTLGVGNTSGDRALDGAAGPGPGVLSAARGRKGPPG